MFVNWKNKAFFRKNRRGKIVDLQTGSIQNGVVQVDYDEIHQEIE